METGAGHTTDGTGAATAAAGAAAEPEAPAPGNERREWAAFLNTVIHATDNATGVNLATVSVPSLRHPGALYCLLLNNGKFYIGKTDNLQERLRQHAGQSARFRGSAWSSGQFSGNMSNVWTSPPTQVLNGYDENYVTQRMMWKYGYEKVRGGAWTHPNPLPGDEMEHLNRLRDDAEGLCRNCGGLGHFISECGAPRRRRCRSGVYANFPACNDPWEAGEDVEDEDQGPQVDRSGVGPEPPNEVADIFGRIHDAISAEGDAGSMQISAIVKMATRLPGKQPPDLNVISRLSGPAQEFLRRYQPQAFEPRGGLYTHQQLVLQHMADPQPRAPNEPPPHHMLLTCGTGTGKSLCFWSWLVHHLTADGSQQSTAIVAFPTQALLWDQAQRITEIDGSELNTFVLARGKELAYGGVLHIGGQEIPWSVWHGTGQGSTRDSKMVEHVQQSDSFCNARILISTVDNIHWNLAKARGKGKARVGLRILKNLRCIVLDEVHKLDGNLGANVHYLLRRLALARQRLQQLDGLAPALVTRPRVFMASATVGDAQNFAARLLGVTAPEDILHVSADAAGGLAPEFTFVPGGKEEAITMMQRHYSRRGADGQLRLIVVVDGSGSNPSDVCRIMSSSCLGPRARALLFSPSKLKSKQTASQLRINYTPATYRSVCVYDADLPPYERRVQELGLNQVCTSMCWRLHLKLVTPGCYASGIVHDC